MKKKSVRIVGGLFAVLLLLCTAFPMMQAEAAAKKVTAIKVTNVTSNKLTLATGKSYQLKVSVTPTNAANKKVSYYSYNTKVATVSSTGKITAKKAGTVKIRIKAKDGSNVVRNITVTVKEASKVIKKLTLPTYTTRRLIVGETYTLKPVVTPAKYQGRSLSYSSSNTKVVKVSQSGVITAVGNGTATVTVKAKDTDTVSTSIKCTVKSYSSLRVKSSQSVAHMGLIYEAPSNSMPAFQKAVDSNAFMGIETDVQETKDGEFVLIHDSDIKSRTNGAGLVSRLSLQQVLSATMNKGTNISQYKNLHIPRLEEYLALCKENGMTPVLHIKSVTSYSKFVQKLKEYGLEDTAIITGSKATMLKFRQVDKNITLSWLCYLTKGNIDWAAANNMDLNVSYADVTQDLCDYAHQKNVKVGAWTVNSYTTAKRVLYQGIDFITGDYKFALYK
ncbi:MAG: Ig-like domain-containing protein [bacterium]|nr:Ig-like domain-containing protein [bacterium]